MWRTDKEENAFAIALVMMWVGGSFFGGVVGAFVAILLERLLR